ncbi:MAG: acyltransferase [Gemmatimonadetes bacterium]|nr:acyltransferase [Gemmatimonadota bacterium]
MSYFAGLVLKILGWSFEGEVPSEKKYVLIAAPHTSNWDFVLMVLYRYLLRMKVNWMGKDSLFRPPLGFFFRAFRGIPIDRSSRNQVVSNVAAEYAKRENLILIITPEGTRGKTKLWKSGFYHIAREAGVPIALAYVDAPRKVVGIHKRLLMPSGDMEADLDVIRSVYQGKVGIRAENAGEIRFSDTSARKS